MEYAVCPAIGLWDNRWGGAHTIRMNTRNKKDINPTDRMIQANKGEADSMLSLWGQKPRRHIKAKKIKR